jgi:hypothetical protein
MLKYKQFNDLNKFYINFFAKKENEIIDHILKVVGMARLDFDKAVKLNEEDRTNLRVNHKKTEHFEKIELLEKKQMGCIVKLFGYDPYKLSKTSLEK